MINALNDLDLVLSHGWVKFDKSWFDPSKKEINYRLKCFLKPIYEHSGNTFRVVVLSDEYIIKKLTLVASEDGKLKMVQLGDQLHPHKYPGNNLFCLGALENQPISSTLITLLMASLLKYNKNDCFHLPKTIEIKNTEKMMEETDAKHSEL